MLLRGWGRGTFDFPFPHPAPHIHFAVRKPFCWLIYRLICCRTVVSSVYCSHVGSREEHQQKERELGHQRVDSGGVHQGDHAEHEDAVVPAPGGEYFSNVIWQRYYTRSDWFLIGHCCQ